MVVRRLKFLLLAIGMGLVIFILSEMNFRETIQLLHRIQFGFVFILFLYFLAFLIDTFTWQLTLKEIPLTATWIYRFFKMRLAGEAFNNLTPFAGMGGEPVKAMLLKQYYGIGYRDGIASLILTKTINVVALILFLVIGFLFVLDSTDLNIKYKTAAGVGLTTFSIGVILFFLVQRLRVTSSTGGFLFRLGMQTRVLGAIKHIKTVEDRLVAFYVEQRIRLIWALVFALGNWILGAFEIFYTMQFLGYPVSMVDAWIIEAITQLVRAGTFFIPASIGAQEGVLVVIGAAITGSTTAGFTTAIVRRIREVIWITWGMLVYYFMKPEVCMDDFQSTQEGSIE